VLYAKRQSTKYSFIRWRFANEEQDFFDGFVNHIHIFGFTDRRGAYH
jgi:hypothetical protein